MVNSLSFKIFRNFIIFCLFLTLLWTQPATNEDGTPCTDLSINRFRVTHVASGSIYTVDVPIWALDDGSPDTVWRSRPGLRDSLRFQLPPGQDPYDWYRITLFSLDFEGNESDSSNTISVNASDY